VAEENGSPDILFHSLLVVVLKNEQDGNPTR
jgi:hypothetical protein